MKIVGAMRVKNESRWIARAIESIQLVCNGGIIIFDDHSTDDTANIARELHCVLVPSPFNTLDEARDKNLLLDLIGSEPEWILMIDGDEMLLPGQAETLTQAIRSCTRQCVSLPILYAWDSETRIRVDGVYGNFRRQSAFRNGAMRFHSRGGANFHCGNVPADIRDNCAYAETPLLHFGYMHSEDRVRKYEWYNANDPANEAEDGYRHIVIGDLLPADSECKHGGPLKLMDLPAHPYLIPRPRWGW